MKLPSVPSDREEATAIRKRLATLAAEQAALRQRLAEIGAHHADHHGSPSLDAPPVTASSLPADKIALFRSLFRGREDVFPRRWTNARSGRSGYAPACANEWAPRICNKPRIKCRECPHRAFIPVTDEVVGRHLRGRDADGKDFTMGVYPLLGDETCRFLAIDFDKHTWRRDAAVFLATCQANRVPAALERSRSGRGVHVWIFFSDPVPASSARRLGAWLLTESMEHNPDIGFESYDRLFPSQDTMPAGGFGNLIALPLQHGPRQSGNSVFLDDGFEPHVDQWRYLSSIRRMTPAEVGDLTEEAGRRGRVLGVRLPVVEDEDEAPWLARPSRKKPDIPIDDPLPETVEVVLGDQVYIARTGLPASVVNRLVRLAAFQNPEFYSHQAMRLPTFGIPRIIGCAELPSHHVALPRGCSDAAEDLLTSLGIAVHRRDERNVGRPIETNFAGELTGEQQASADALLLYDTGVLAGGPPLGQTRGGAGVVGPPPRHTQGGGGRRAR
ncbi:MAG: restriction endonuclease subunit R, partial [Spirochaetaceae bacterium]|nr:restriction endonuclease subunit R [Spirochaetaceae bacterium]